ncbi:class A beta-lactamase [Streptomyces sp. HNM0575]|uniref:class A beta-lactamase n=1 Tax=Streptomyces sp. HNM0575 TaxID=2716338 RepID=UPI00145EEA1A|nr:class A beta-lactamase [Streptomyces sp. HNM0575]NLU73912.1 class A beta-lactamase [Streptomyces sp. HNM0575]
MDSPSRRSLLAAGAGSVLTGLCTSACTSGPGTAGESHGDAVHGVDVTGPVRRLEREHAARVGAFAYHTGSGRTLLHRADERFPLCSTWKPLAAAALLSGRHHDRHHDGGGDVLAKRVHYSKSDLEEYSPVTGTREHLDHGMTVRQLCDAAVRYSDNAAANLLLRELGGPGAITRFCRSLGDEVTRLDRTETELNSAEPWRKTDTTSPRALARTYMRLTLGDALDRSGRRQLTDWLKHNTTGGKSLRAGLPDGWTAAEKTGSGAFGTNNDVGIAWTPRDRTPVVLAVFTTKRSADAEPDYPLIAKTARLLARALA